MRPRALAPLLPLLLLLGLPTAAAENLASMDTTVGEPQVVKPGEQGAVAVQARYCYSNSPLAPANVDVSIKSAPEWLGATVTPTRFRADTPSGQRCGTKEVQVQYTVNRNAPAFSPGSIVAAFDAPGADREATAIVQAAYWAELTVAKPPRIRVARGDQGTIELQVGVAANEATRLEITGNDPERQFNLLSRYDPVGGAGTGLDNTVNQRMPLTVTVGPETPLGVRPFTLTLTTHYDRLPTTVGETETVVAEIEVVQGASTPFPGAAMLALGAAAAAVLAARRVRR